MDADNSDTWRGKKDCDGGAEMPERLYSIYQVADLLGTSPSAVAEWMQGGSLPCMRLPDGPVRISGHGLRLFMKSHGIDATDVLGTDTTNSGSYKSVQKITPQETSPNATPTTPKSTPVQAGPDSDDKPEYFNPPIDLTDDEDFLSTPMPRTGDRDYQPEISQVDPIPQMKIPEQIHPDELINARRDDQVFTTAEEIDEQDYSVCDSPVEKLTVKATTESEHLIAESILSCAVQMRASHIHIEPDWDNLHLRMRIDGVLQSLPDFTSTLPKGIGPGVIQDLKNLAGITLGKQGVTSAEFTFAAGDHDIECFLSTYPTLRGERIVISVIDTSIMPPKLDELGLDREDELSLRRLLRESTGLVIVASKPRSGRGTVLKAMVASLAAPDRSIITIENSPSPDPSGINQTIFDREIDFTVADALSAAGAQDPDIVMVDDISDAQTALAAMNLALQGRLVLAGMYAPGSPAAIEGLGQLGLDRWSLSKVLLAVVAPRTIRRLCQHCREIVAPPVNLLENLGLSNDEISFPIYEARACAKCHQSGYDGRTAIFSLMEINQAIASVIRHGGDAPALDRSALQAGMKSLSETAIQKLRDGITSLDEVARAIPHSVFSPTE